MARKCSTCQHVKRAEINRRLAAGEPGNQIASDYDLNPSSLHRHRANCLGPSSSNTIMNVVRHEIFGPILLIFTISRRRSSMRSTRATGRSQCTRSPTTRERAIFYFAGDVGRHVRQRSDPSCHAA
jgi:hypothetical protein